MSHSRLFQLIKDSVYDETDLIGEDDDDARVPTCDYMAESDNFKEDIEWLKDMLPTIYEKSYDTRKGLKKFYIKCDAATKQICLNIINKSIIRANEGLSTLRDIVKKCVQDNTLDQIDFSYKSFVIKQALDDKYGFYFYVGKSGEAYPVTTAGFISDILREDENTVYTIAKTLDYHS